MSRQGKNRQSNRKAGYDYSQAGAYFVTICTYKGDLIFGDVVDGQMELTDVGEIARNCWTTVPNHFGTVSIDCFVVMPNHVHAIVILHGDASEPEHSDDSADSSRTVGTRHVLSLHDHHISNRRGVMKEGRFYPAGVKPKSLGAVVGSYKSAVTKITNRTLADPPSFLWQKGYHDHIIQDEKSFKKIRGYVLTNPARWDDDRFNW